MFFAVAAHSEDIDANGVLEELLEQCRESLGDRIPQAGRDEPQAQRPRTPLRDHGSNQT